MSIELDEDLERRDGLPIFEIMEESGRHIKIYVNGMVEGVEEPYQIVNMIGPLIQHVYSSWPSGTPKEKAQRWLDAIAPFQKRFSSPASPHQNEVNSPSGSGGSQAVRENSAVISPQT